jgi:hypothetical protein
MTLQGPACGDAWAAGKGRWRWSDLVDDDHSACAAGHRRSCHHPVERTAHCIDCAARGIYLFCLGLLRQQAPADPDQWKAQLRQHGHRREGTGHGHVEGFAVKGIPPDLLRPSGEDHHVTQPQRGAGGFKMNFYRVIPTTL